MAYGRGGVGNIQALEQETARVAADLEANQQAAGASSQYNALPGKEEPKFAHTGRGGMGNYYSPEELSQTGHFRTRTGLIFQAMARSSPQPSRGVKARVRLRTAPPRRVLRRRVWWVGAGRGISRSG